MIVAGLVALVVVELAVAAVIFGAVAAGAAAERRAELAQMRPKPDPTVDIERYANCPHHPAWGPARHVEGRAS